MSLTQLNFFILVGICFIFSSFPLKQYKAYLFALANIVFLYSYGWMQCIFALIFTLIIYLFAKVYKQYHPAFIYGITIVIGLMICQRLSTSFSFLTFFSLMAFSYSGLKGIRYLNDVRNKKVHKISLIRLFAYLFYFPSFLQGPIMDYVQFNQLIEKDDGFNYKRRRVGFMQSLLGYTSRSVLVLAILPVYTAIFTNPTNYSSGVKIIALLTFCIVLYLDWDAYSNIVVGISKLLGMPISENFKAPLLANDAGSFWNRWHISLSTFLKDLVYIPLGGSRCSFARSCLNTIVTFAVCGLWHGLNGLYLIWGIINGLAVCMVKPFKKQKETIFSFVIKRLSKWIVLLALSVYGFTSLGAYFEFLTNIGIQGETTLAQLFTKNQWIVYLSYLFIYFLFDWLRSFKDPFILLAKLPVVVRFLIYFICIFAIMCFGVYGPGYNASNFIYQLF